MIRRLFVAGILLAGIAFFAPSPASAAPMEPSTTFAATCQGGVEGFLLLRTWDACLNHDGLGVPQIENISSVWVIVLVVIEDAIKAAGYVAVGFLTWGGIKYIKSQGDPSQINEARMVIYNSLFGLLLTLISVAIVNFVAGAL